VVVQSGGVGMALLEHLSRLGVGLSSFASVGDGYDVGSNDMLLWWESDGRTGLGVLYVESFGDPRRFARTARRVGRRMPLMTVVTGGRTPGPRAAASRIGTGAMLAVTREALFGQAGIIATHGLGELVGVAALLAHQPVPAGPRVAIVSNGGAAGALAAEACADAGLSVPELGEGTRARLAALLPGDAACAGPVDTTAAVDPSRFRRALDLVAGDDSVDGLLALVAPTALGDLTDLTAAIGRTRKPTVAVVLGQAEAVTVRGDAIPSYAYPEDAARALSHAWSYGRWRARAPGAEPRLADLCPAGARDVVEDFLVRRPEGGWLRSAEAMRLLGCYRVPLVPWRPAGSEEETVRAAAELGGRVALKGDVPGAVHKSEVGGVRLDLFGEGEVRRAYRRLCACFGDGRTAVIVQRMAKDGIEVLCGVSQDPVFGPLLTFGLGGAATEGLGDRTVRLVPLTDVDAAELVRGALCASPLLGHRDRPAAGSAALEEALLRLSRLAADLPEMAELELDPLIARPDGAVAVDVRVRVTPVRRWDPYLRRLR
jgi:acyl-CoA synthetase (NDP forming)